jgi:hypothetical protein
MSTEESIIPYLRLILEQFQSLLEVLEVFCSHSRVIGTGMGKRKIVGVERISQLGPELIEIVLGTQI